MRRGIPRRSAKKVVETYATELLLKAELATDRDERTRLLCYLHALEILCIRMDWFDLDSKIEGRRGLLIQVNP